MVLSAVYNKPLIVNTVRLLFLHHRCLEGEDFKMMLVEDTQYSALADKYLEVFEAVAEGDVDGGDVQQAVTAVLQAPDLTELHQQAV